MTRKAFRKSAIFMAAAAMLGFSGVITADTVTVEVSAKGSDRDEAIERAISKAPGAAFGTYIVSLAEQQGGQFRERSQEISSGLVQSHRVLSEQEVGDQFAVQLEVDVTEERLTDAERTETFFYMAEQAGALTAAQHAQETRRQILDEFVGHPSVQLERGYHIVPAGFEIHDIRPDEIEGVFLVEVAPNQAWWEAYYQILEHMPPMTSKTVFEGPLEWQTSSALGCHAGQNADVLASTKEAPELDKALRYHGTHPLPVTVRLGEDHKKDVILYKNAIFRQMDVAAHTQGFEDTNRAGPCAEEYVQTGAIVTEATSMGHVDAFFSPMQEDPEVQPNARMTHALDKDTAPPFLMEGGSELDGAAYSDGHGVASGERFVIKIPFEVKEEEAIHEALGELEARISFPSPGDRASHRYHR